jgi:hypothetical protein
MRESRVAKGGQPFAWGFVGAAPDHPSLSPADSGGKNNFATALARQKRPLVGALQVCNKKK